MGEAMETPVQIDFQGMAAEPQILGVIDKHVSELEQWFGRITAGRVALKGPGGHHRIGVYEINIRLELPGGREGNGTRVTAGRVALKAPGGHHRIGLYEINIRLELPDGREVNVTRTPGEDDRQSDLNFAINDAFKHARRQLQDHVRTMKDKLKH